MADKVKDLEQIEVKAEEPKKGQRFENRTITQVTHYGLNRYFFEVDGEPFAGFDKNRKDILTNSFSKNLKTIMKQVGAELKPLRIANTMVAVKKGYIINPTYVALILNYATITFTRVKKTAAELLEDTDLDEKSISGDAYVTTFESIKLNMSEDEKQVCAQIFSGKFEGEPLFVKIDEEKKEKDKNDIDKVASDLFG